MRKRRRVWFDPVGWPISLRWALFVPLACLVTVFIVAVYGTLNDFLVWGPHRIMRGVLAAAAAIGLIFTAAYVAPRHKRWVALGFAVVPLLAAVFPFEVADFLRADIFTTLGYVSGTIIGLFAVFSYRSEASLVTYGPERSPIEKYFPYRRD